jgi:GntR family transcriptional regulator
MSGRPAPVIRRDLSVPYYEQLKALIVQQIERDGLKPGDLIPSEGALCQQHDVSRTVVRQAIGDLVNEGLLHRQRGKGTFVARPKLREQFMESTVGFFEDLTSHGHRVSGEVIGLQIVDASATVAQALEVDVGSRCIELIRLRAVNGEVAALTKSYVNSSDESLLEDLRRADLSTTSLYRILEEHWGMRVESGRRSLEATKAKGALANMLQVRSGEPVLYIESVGRDASERVMEYFQAWHRADRTRLEMNVVRDHRPRSNGTTIGHR